jgi:hypothetical protein
LIKDIKNETINKYLQDLTAKKDTEYSLWQATKGLKRAKTQIPPIKKDKTWARSVKQKANLFAIYLEEMFQPLPRQTTEESLVSVAKNNEQEIQSVTLMKLKREIKTNLNVKKAPGYDLITGRIIKELPEIGLQKLQHLINVAYRLKYVPRQWKVIMRL